MKPTVGKIVHFFLEESSKPWAAVITEVHDDNCINLSAFYPSGSGTEGFTSVVKQSDATVNRCWNWPEIIRDKIKG